MTLQTLPLPLAYPGFGLANSSTVGFSTEATISAAGHYVAGVWRAREAMTVSHVAYRSNAVAGSPTADIRIETVDATTGLPTGTLFGTNTNIVTGTLTTTMATHALTASASINAGDFFAVKIGYNSGTSIGVGYVTQARTGLGSFPYKVVNTGTPTIGNLANRSLLLALGSSSTSFYKLPNMLPMSSSSVTNSISTSNYDAVGVRFKVPFKCRCVGLIHTMNSSTYGPFTYGIYNDAGTEVSSSSTSGYDSDISAAGAGGNHVTLFFDNAVTLSPDTWYRAAMWPTSSTAFVGQVYSYANANLQAIGPGGTNWHYTRKALAGAWDDSFTTDCWMMNLLLDQLDDGVGSGGGAFSVFGG